jgi:hypothetical protein
MAKGKRLSCIRSSSSLFPSSLKKGDFISLPSSKSSPLKRHVAREGRMKCWHAQKPFLSSARCEYTGGVLWQAWSGGLVRCAKTCSLIIPYPSPCHFVLCSIMTCPIFWGSYCNLSATSQAPNGGHVSTLVPRSTVRSC